MKMRTILKRLPFGYILVISIILGVMLGSGIALAEPMLWFDLDIGWNYLDGELTDWGYGFSTSHWEWMNSSRTRVDLDDTRHWDGWDDPPWTAKYGILWVYDEYGYDTKDFWYFSGFNLEGNDLYYDTNWTMDQLSSSNNYVYTQQLINYGSKYSCLVEAHTGQ